MPRSAELTYRPGIAVETIVLKKGGAVSKRGQRRLDKKARAMMKGDEYQKRKAATIDLENKWRGAKKPKPLNYYSNKVGRVVSGGLPELGKRR